MPLQLAGVHVSSRVPNSDEQRLVKTNHYVRIGSDQGPPIYIQGGEIYSEGGPLLDEKDIPDWFWPEVNKLNDHALRAVKFKIPEDKVGVRPPDEDEEAVSTTKKASKRVRR